MRKIVKVSYFMLQSSIRFLWVYAYIYETLFFYKKTVKVQLIAKRTYYRQRLFLREMIIRYY